MMKVYPEQRKNSVILLFILGIFCPVYAEATPLLPESSIIQVTDSLRKEEKTRILPAFGFGAGSGFHMGFNMSILKPGSPGVSLRLNTNLVASNSIPSDYYDDNVRSFTPLDYVSTFSIDLLHFTPLSNNIIRFGFEAGPSVTFCNMAKFEPNPWYNPEGFLSRRYLKTHDRANTIGLSLYARMQVIPARYFGLECAAYANINNQHPIGGASLYFLFGHLKNRRSEE